MIAVSHLSPLPTNILSTPKPHRIRRTEYPSDRIDSLLAEDNASYLNKSTSQPFGHFIGARYPYLPKLLVPDTNPYWTNKTAVKADYFAGGVHSHYNWTDWSPEYNLLAQGIIEGEHATISIASNDSTTADQWKPLLTMHPTNQWFTGGPTAIASEFYPDAEWLTFDTCQSGHADFPPNPPIPWWNARRGWEPVEIMYAKGGRYGPVLDNEPHYENR